MRRSKVLSLLLSFAMLLTMSPGVISATDVNAAAEDAVPVVTAATGWQPKPTQMVSSKSAFPLTLNDGDVLQIDGSVDYTAPIGKSPITLAAGADAKIIINGRVTLRGANASGTTGATAAINVPEGARLTIYSAHDEELSTSTEAPKDTLTVTGGNAAAGTDGGDAIKSKFYEATGLDYTWTSGSGGNGGGGAAAAIGGNGGSGGNGGAGERSPAAYIFYEGDIYYGEGTDDNPGKNGNNGGAAGQGQGAGTIYVAGRLNLNATGGSGASGGNGGSGCGGLADVTGIDIMIGGCGGGGGGGGGLTAPAIGAGASGGSGGGSGGLLSSDVKGDVQGCGGGGGGGGWPNGGGGGGGGSECSKAENKNDNHSEGGSGGTGGAAGQKGSAGSAGTQTGTSGHGLNDTMPGGGGNGGGGIEACSYLAVYPLNRWLTCQSTYGGSGGKEKDNKYNGGHGGDSGSPAEKKEWNSQGNLILSTAANLKLTSSTGYAYGDGQGCSIVKDSGTDVSNPPEGCISITPNIIYDLMDCQVTLNPSEYTYTGQPCKPSVTSVAYSAASDRDGASVGNGNGATLSTGDCSVTGYGENIHCRTGTIMLTGAQDANRTMVTTDGAVVGTKTAEFPINKAELTNVTQKYAPDVYVNQPVSLSLSYYTSATTDDGLLKNLLRESSQKTEGPQVTWQVTQGTGSFSGSGLDTTFTPTSAGTVKIQAVLTDMNNFNDYTTATISLIVQEGQTLTATISPDQPHPKKPVTVTLTSEVTSAAYQWYADGTEISGATGASYTPSNSDIGKILSVKITPNAASTYRETMVTVKNVVENHDYNDNGFCTMCDEYEPAVLSGDTYQVSNGGQMFWLAALINGDKDHAEFEGRNTYAKGILTADINLENREWKPIYDLNGSFDGQNHTITNMKITQTVNCSGFVGTSNGVISNFTLEGDIKLPDIGGTYVGGAVGYMNGGTVSNIVSKVTISNNSSSKEYKHVGGVIGEITNSETTVTKCVFEGSVNLSNSTDCIGGVVGYSNGGGRISYCANRGTVKAAAQNAYAGGILGYVNNASVTLRNCYNYGSVQNGGGNYCGAIVGYLRGHTAGNFNDNYYLNTSAASGFGSGSNGTTASAPAKTTAQFESGEVCYMINGSSSTEDVIWRQDVDNGSMPYDVYPVFDGSIVLQNRKSHNCATGEYTYAYSNSASAAEEHVNHNYDNGFCTCCDVRQPATLSGTAYQIGNGGQLFWFAEQMNSGAIASNSNAVLTADIDLEGRQNSQAAGYEGITKDRSFPGIGTSSVPFGGIFTGVGHDISDLYIARENEGPSEAINGVGLFGCTNDATISGLTVKGQLLIHGSGDHAIQRVGGIIGWSKNTELSEVMSYVDIQNKGTGNLAHVGGVVGTAENDGSIFKCMYFGSIDLKNTSNCIGGIAGYTNTTAISYCANHGSVKTDSQDGYTGGVLGYINNTGGSIRNCYNYGTVQNGGGAYCGAIVGYLRGHNAGNFTDNYYLNTSAASGFGSGSSSTTAKASAKDAAAFASGEVCCLVNSKTSTGNTAIWKQDIDNGNTPYDIYPLFDAAAVYFRSDSTYSNEPEEISVTISWGAMEFEYSAGHWNPDTHEYNGGWSPLAADGNDLTVQNDSNVALEVGFIFTADADFTQYNLTGTFNGVTAGLENRMERGTTLSTELNLKSLNPEDVKDKGKQKLGDITVRLTTIGGGGD